MNNLLLVGLLSCSTVFAGEPIIGMEKIEKAKAFLKKTPKCTLAVGTLSDAKEHKGFIFEKVFCVADYTTGEGSTSAKKGCGLMELNLRTGTYQGTSGPLGKQVAQVTTECADGGFAELLDRPGFYLTVDGSKILSVRDMLAGRVEPKGNVGERKLVYLYGAHPNWEKLFKEAGK